MMKTGPSLAGARGAKHLEAISFGQVLVKCGLLQIAFKLTRALVSYRFEKSEVREEVRASFVHAVAQTRRVSLGNVIFLFVIMILAKFKGPDLDVHSMNTIRRPLQE